MMLAECRLGFRLMNRYRLRRSTSDVMLCLPNTCLKATRSHSQWPNVVRSPISAGRLPIVLASGVGGQDRVAVQLGRAATAHGTDLVRRHDEIAA